MTSSRPYPVAGAGLGLRRAFLDAFLAAEPAVDFVEVAPENWLGVGGALGRKLWRVSERYPLVCHGLSLSIGSNDPLDSAFLRRLRDFLDAHQVRCYTEHLSYCSDGGHLYDLMPLPFTAETVRHVAARVRHVQDVLGRRIGLENVSYYATVAQDLSEREFLCAVLEEADCDLHLDVNNVYVNAINHGYDAGEFLRGLPGERIAYAHVAGHYVEAEDLRIDTHGAAVIDPVWQLLGAAYGAFGVFPTLLERDFNIPPLPELLDEVQRIAALQAHWEDRRDDRRAIA
jgi:uncharacterized protein (UPF0276 family)